MSNTIHTARSPHTAVREYLTYAEAQRAVDHLADNEFPVHTVSIIGRGLSSVEHVTGRLTKGRAALAGAGTGAWLGLFVGLLLGLFRPGLVWLEVLLTAVLLGTAWGAAIGFVGHWATGGRRDFSSMQTLSAQQYDVLVPEQLAPSAEQLLATLDR